MESLLPVPMHLKVIRPYVKVGIEIAKRDPCVSYYCNFYALQSALKTNYKGSPEAKAYLLKLMDYVESQKEILKANPDQAESVSNDITGQAVVESAAMKLFVWADSQDRNSIFNKHVVKSFYTASILFDVMDVFDDGLSDEAKTHRKYARWKATYIHNCLKNNEKPIPGPVGGLENEWGENEGCEMPHSSEQQPSTSHGEPPYSGGVQQPPQNLAPKVSAQPRAAPRSVPNPEPAAPSPSTYPTEDPAPSTGGSSLSPQDMRDAEKLCKFAASSLQYDDVPTAIQYLEKCLRLLRTGQQ